MSTSNPNNAAELCDAAKHLQVTGNVGTSGNISVRTDDGFLITPSGAVYEDLQAGQMVALTMDGKNKSDGRPSSEWRFHRDIYRHFPAAGSVVHTHSPYATVLACRGLSIPAFHYEVAFAGGKDIRCAPYATFGTEALSNYVIEALRDRQACLMANHGMVCFHGTLAGAMTLAAKVESLAMMYHQVLCIGEPFLLSSEEMDRVLEKFSDYGGNSND